MTQDYLANCIDRILMAACEPSCVTKRARDLADVVRIAASEGEAAAHRRLVELSDDAIRGRYSKVEMIEALAG